MTTTEPADVDFVLTPADSYARDDVPPVPVQLPDRSLYHAYCPKDAFALALMDIENRVREGGDLQQLRILLAEVLSALFDVDAAEQITARALDPAFRGYGLRYVVHDLLPAIVDHFAPQLEEQSEAIGLAPGANREERRAAKKTPRKKPARSRQEAGRPVRFGPTSRVRLAITVDGEPYTLLVPDDGRVLAGIAAAGDWPRLVPGLLDAGSAARWMRHPSDPAEPIGWRATWRVTTGLADTLYRMPWWAACRLCAVAHAQWRDWEAWTVTVGFDPGRRRTASARPSWRGYAPAAASLRTWSSWTSRCSPRLRLRSRPGRRLPGSATRGWSGTWPSGRVGARRDD
ncbi:hypothetical protein [Streptomyces millisiae]|uniref:Uncharacterized protein n=1 Tax=Streptomyces millisiae TaxID=3075542 RepID=A0ABU2LMM0_9ACTN|nr:hypothetical protein [Streptomyces sp. DSM 44918]MDT0318827.1 hypothetical protein [Streptomyces sp. DSM 44918]